MLARHGASSEGAGVFPGGNRTRHPGARCLCAAYLSPMTVRRGFVLGFLLVLGLFLLALLLEPGAVGRGGR
jgi:hypothetical protein